MGMSVLVDVNLLTLSFTLERCGGGGKRDGENDVTKTLGMFLEQSADSKRLLSG
jgi:hypothetical protein